MSECQWHQRSMLSSTHGDYLQSGRRARISISMSSLWMQSAMSFSTTNNNASKCFRSSVKWGNWNVWFDGDIRMDDGKTKRGKPTHAERYTGAPSHTIAPTARRKQVKGHSNRLFCLQTSWHFGAPNISHNIHSQWHSVRPFGCAFALRSLQPWNYPISLRRCRIQFLNCFIRIWICQTMIPITIAPVASDSSGSFWFHSVSDHNYHKTAVFIDGVYIYIQRADDDDDGSRTSSCLATHARYRIWSIE